MQNDANSPSPFFTNQPTPPVTPPSAPEKKSKKKLFIIIASIAVLLLTILAIIFIPRIIQSVELANLDKGLPYIYKPAMTDLEPTGKFEYKLGFTPKESTGQGRSDYSEYIQIYSDEAFTKPATDSLPILSINKDKLTFAPSPSVGMMKAYDTASRGKVPLAKEYQWGMHEKYFIVQYVDLNSGEKLKKPIVQPFTIKKTLAAPQVVTSFDAQGNLKLRWNKVEGATGYYVARAGIGTGRDISIYDTVTDTEWSSATSRSGVGLAGFTQNELIRATRTADSFVKTSQIDDSNGSFSVENNVDVAVIAFNDTETSAYSSVNTSELRARAPSGFATNTADALNVKLAGETPSMDAIPANVPVTLADGRTALQYIDLAVDQARISTTSLIDVEAGRGVETLDVPYTVRGTELKFTFRITNFDRANYRSQLDAVVAKNKSQQIKTGAASYEVLADEDIPTDNRTIASSRPTVPYPVYSTNSFSDYLAANLINGAELIDVKQYVNGPITPNDAFAEATNQNPYVMYVTGMRYNEKKQLIEVRYGVKKEERDQRMKALQDKVKSIVGNITTASMSPTDKVRAINKYIADNTTYNYDAYDAVKQESYLLIDSRYKDAWTAYGVLFEGNAVCGGYAVAFNALAREAGLESVYVTGNLDNTVRHAWNKVKIDGEWRLVDVTWNDSASEPNKYLLITDEETSKLRNQVDDKYWIADPFLREYAAV